MRRIIEFWVNHPFVIIVIITMITSSTAALTALPAVINIFHPLIKAEKDGNH